MIRIAIADDHPVTRYGLINGTPWKENNMKVVVVAGNGKELLNGMKKNKTDVVLLDIQMPVLNGEETCKIIRKKFPKVKILAYSFHERWEKANIMFKAGANGFMCKQCEPKDILEAVSCVMKGEKYLSKHILDKEQKPLHPDELTDDEKDVLICLCRDSSAKEIAQQLGTKTKTVEKIKSQLLKKTNSKSVIGLIKYAFKNGLAE